MSSLLAELAAGLVDLLCPPRCLVCGAYAEPFCKDCAAGIVPAADLPPPSRVAAVRCAGYHEGPLRAAVLRLKFQRKTGLVAPLGELAAREVTRALNLWQPTLLVPVPIHWGRRLERGFNQAELLAEHAGDRLGLAVVSALRRTRAAPPQARSTAAARAENVRGAFAHEPCARVRGERVVLLDDVWTTGATLSECAQVLRAAGAAEVCAVTLTHEPLRATW